MAKFLKAQNNFIENRNIRFLSSNGL